MSDSDKKSQFNIVNGKEAENHIGYIVSGRMMVQDLDGNAFEIPPGSDAWVLGDEPCVALDFIPTRTVVL